MCFAQKSDSTENEVRSVLRCCSFSDYDNQAIANKVFLLTNSNPQSMSFVSEYERSEKKFRQILKQREEMFQKLEDKISDTSKEISHFQEKNEELIDRIKQLDVEIENERNRTLDSIKLGYTNTSTTNSTNQMSNVSTAASVNSPQQGLFNRPRSRIPASNSSDAFRVKKP